MADDDQKPWEKYQKKAAAAAAPPPGGKPWLKYQAPAAAPPVAAAKPQEFHLRSEMPPENARFPALGRRGYDVADFLAGAMPTALSVGGGMLAAPLGPLGAVAGAATGGAAGDRLRRSIYEGMYKNLEPETVGGAATSTAEQGLLGGFSEGQAQTVNYLAQPLLRNLAVTRQILKEADAGTNVRLTSGEAGGWPSLKLAENVTAHWPGGAGTFEGFRSQQEADINRMMDAQLKSISERNLTAEEAGQEVQDAVRQAKAQLDPGVDTDLARVQTAQENRSQGIIEQQLKTLSPRQTSSEDLGRQLQDQVRGEQQQLQATTERDLERIRDTQQRDLNSTFDPDLNALNPVTGTTSEQAGAAIKGNLQAQQDAAQASLKANVDQVRAAQQTHVKQVIDQQAQALSPQQLTSEEAGLQVKNSLTGLQRQSDAAIAGKYDQVKVKVGRQPGAYVSPKELGAAADEVPEAKSLLEEANLLFKQEQLRFDVPIVKKVVNAPPEEISSLLKNASLDDLRTLKGYLPAQVQQGMARELWESMVYTATKRGALSTDSLANQLKGLGEAHGRLIFGDRYNSVVKAADEIDAANAAADRTVAQHTAQAEAPFASKLTKDILSKPPEQLPNLMMTASLEDLRALKAAIPQDAYNSAANQVLRRVITPPRGEIVSEKSLAKAMAELGPERGRLIFGDRYDSITASIGRFNQINKSAEASAAQVNARPSPFTTSGLYRDIAETNKPEEIVEKKVHSAGLEELRQLTSSLSPEMQQDLRRNVLTSILERPGVRDAQTGIINEKKFGSELQRLGEARGRVIFGEQYDGLVNSSKILDRVNEAARVQRAAVSGRSSRYDAGLLKQIITTNDPLLISGYLAKAGPDELRTLMRDLPPETRQAAARNTLEHFITPARAPQNMESGELDPKQLAESLNENLKKLGPARGRAIFGKNYDNIVDASAMLQTIGYSESGMMGKMHMAGLITGTFGSIGAAGGAVLRGAPGAALGAVAGGAGALASTVPLAKSFAWMLTSPNFSEYMVRNLRDLTAAVVRGVPSLVINEELRSSPARYPSSTDELREFQNPDQGTLP